MINRRHIRFAFCVGALLAPTFAHADMAETVLRSCLAKDPDLLTVVSFEDVEKDAGTRIVMSLDAVTEMGRRVAQSGPAADWSIEDTLIAGYGQDTDSLRSGAVQSEVLSSDLGLLIRWENHYIGTVCLLPITAQADASIEAAAPIIGEDVIIWRAATSSPAVEYVSQIFIMSDRPS